MSDRQLDAQDLADGSLGLGPLGGVEVLGDGAVQRGGPSVLHALELGQEVGVEDLVDADATRWGRPWPAGRRSVAASM